MRTPAALCLIFAACSGNGGESSGDSLGGSLRDSNVLLVTLDTTRADALGCYGGPDWSSPRLDALAAEGIRFDQARSTNPVTLPSHATILTGLRPFEHGVRDNGTFRLAQSTDTLAERLGAAGYATGAVIGAVVLHSDYGLDQGFDSYADVPRRTLEMTTVEDQRTAAEVVDEALKLLDAGALPEPFLLWVHMFDPHRPLTPPEPFAAKAREGVSAATPYAEFERRMYHAEVAFADAEIGRLLDGLGERLAGELLTVFVSDHGEGFGEHGEPAHGLQVFDTTMRVPALVQHPRLPADLVIDAPISTADLAPTVLSLLGIEAAGTTGRDLSPLFGDPAAELAPSETGSPVYLETCHSYYSYGWSPLYATLVDGLKVIEGPAPAVYDLAADPFELINLAHNRPELIERARASFAALAPRTVAGQRVEVDEEDRIALEQLGYTGGADDGTGGPLIPGQLDPSLANPGERIAVKQLCEMAVAQMAEGDQQRALASIRRVLAEDPYNPIFLSQAGSIFIGAGQLDEAKRALRITIERREDASARCSLAIAHNLAGELDEAIEVLLENVALHPEHLHTRFALGELLLERNRPEDAAMAAEHFDAFLATHAARDAWHETAEALAARAHAAALLR